MPEEAQLLSAELALGTLALCIEAVLSERLENLLHVQHMLLAGGAELRKTRMSSMYTTVQRKWNPVAQGMPV